MNAPTVSVALATYQGARFVDEQVRSILGQSRPVDEIVLGDDGSTDGTVDRVRAILGASPDAPPLIVLPSTARVGVAANFTRVLLATSGDLVLLCDQDDRWHPDRVAAAVLRFAAEPELDVLFGDARLIDAAGRDLGSTLFDALPVREPEVLAVEARHAASVFLRRNLATGATMALRRRALDRALPVPEPWIHDEWLATTTAIVGAIGVERRALVDYRQHGANVIGVARSSLRDKVRRVRAPRGDRNQRLGRAFTVLAEWADEAGAPAEIAGRVAAKAAFEQRRAGLPRLRLARLPGVLAGLSGYRAFASQGLLDVARDLLQPSPRVPAETNVRQL